MFSLIFADNSFWRYEHFIFSVLSGACIYYMYIAFNKFENLRPDVADEYKVKKLILTAVTAHLCLQFCYHFIYNLAIIEYTSRLVFIIIVIYLNRTFLTFQKTITEENRAQLEKAQQVFAAFVLFVAFLSILNAKSQNSCGQNLYGMYMLIYCCVSGVSLFNGYLNLKTISSDIQAISSFRETMSAADIKIALATLEQLSTLRIVLFHFLLAITLSGFFGIILMYAKFHDLGSTLLCKDLNIDKGFLYKVFFAVFEFAIVNALNGFIYYHYFWKFRAEFEFKKELIERTTHEAFNPDRSIIIRHEKDGLEEN